MDPFDMVMDAAATLYEIGDFETADVLLSTCVDNGEER